jgi:hypothetical protein
MEDDVRRLLDRCTTPASFFLASSADLEWEHQVEEIPWEIYKGRLLEPAHSRSGRRFEAWNVHWVEDGSRSREPILSLKLDWPARQIHVVRAIHSYVWEAYEAGEKVILSRETTRWVRELVGTILIDSLKSGGELLDEAICKLFQAVVGVSRLPLTSLEAPLPAFLLGQMAYFFQSSPETTIRSVEDLIRRFLKDELAQREKIKLLETILRATPREQLSEAAALFVARWQEIGHSVTDIPMLLRDLFEEVSLSPYTDFVEKTLAFAQLLQEQGAWGIENRIDFLNWLLRHVGRHLTAYDLVTFHHRGANYPDALLLDEALQDYLDIMESQPEFFLPSPEETDSAGGRKRLRRRGLRQAWLLRRWYEGHLVPDAPTSPGENRRVLPFPHPRIPEEQILQPETRTRRLYEYDSLDRHLKGEAAAILRQSLGDLDRPEELQELGMALFLDRPLGVFKNPGEPDQTPLLSYEAFSRSITQKRLHFLSERMGLLEAEKATALEQKLRERPVEGYHPCPGSGPARPGSVSLSDALKSAPDFVILRTTKKSAGEFLSYFRFETLDSPDQLRQPCLILRTAGEGDGRLTLYDDNRRKRWELQIDPSQGYDCRAGIELPRAGLRLIGVWNQDGLLIEVPNISIPIR